MFTENNRKAVEKAEIVAVNQLVIRMIILMIIRLNCTSKWTDFWQFNRQMKFYHLVIISNYWLSSSIRWAIRLGIRLGIHWAIRWAILWEIRLQTFDDCQLLGDNLSPMELFEALQLESLRNVSDSLSIKWDLITGNATGGKRLRLKQDVLNRATRQN